MGAGTPSAPAPTPPARRRSRRRPLLVVGAVAALALAGGGATWALRDGRSPLGPLDILGGPGSTSATTTDRAVVPSDAWADGAESAWTLGLPPQASTESTDRTDRTTGLADVYRSASYIAVIGGGEPEVQAWDISGEQPSPAWSGSLDGTPTRFAFDGADPQEIFENSGILGHYLIRGNTALDLRSGDSTLTAWPAGSQLTFFADGLVVACTENSPEARCAAYDASLEEKWSSSDLPGDPGKIPASLTVNTVAADGALRSVLASDTGEPVILDLTTGDLIPMTLPTWTVDWSSVLVHEALRDGWAGCEADLTDSRCMVWDLEGHLLNPEGAIELSKMVVPHMVTAGGEPTTQDWLREAKGQGAADFTGLSVSYSGEECRSLVVNGSEFPEPASWKANGRTSEGGCQDLDVITASGDGHAAMRWAWLFGQSSVLSDTNGVVLTSESGAYSGLVRPDLFLVFALDQAEPTIAAFRPAASGTVETSEWTSHPTIPWTGSTRTSPSPPPDTGAGSDGTLGATGTSDSPGTPATTGTPTPTPKPTTPVPPVAGAPPGAGGPVPAGATEIRTITTLNGAFPTAVIKTPSGNILCDITETWSGCGILSLLEDRTYGSTDIGPRWQVSFGDGVPTLEASDSGLQAFTTSGPVQTVEYGQVVHHGSFVCSSAQEGLTCWDSETGHGAFMSRARVETF